MRSLFLIPLLALSLYAQQLEQPNLYVTTNPTGPCAAGVPNTTNTVTRDYSVCGGSPPVWGTVNGASGSVTSFGPSGSPRAGVVTTQTGDYTAAMVTNAISSLGSYSDPTWITALSASKILSLTITTTGTPLSGSYSAGGITITWPGTPTKAQLLSTVVYHDQANSYGAYLQDFHLSSFELPVTTVGSLPAAGSSTNLVYVVTDGVSSSDCVTGGSNFRALCTVNDAGTAWIPLGGVGGGGSGITALYQTTDFQVTKTSSTVETINAAVSSTAPAINGVKDVSYPFVASSTLTISGTSSTGSVYWCALKDGTLSAYSSVAATLTPSSGLSFNSGSSCPTDSRTLWITTMTGNVWNAITEAMDYRAYQQIVPEIQPGAFSTSSVTGNIETLGVDPTQVAGTGPKLASVEGSPTAGHYAGFGSDGGLIDNGTGTGGVTTSNCLLGTTSLTLDTSGTSTGCPPTQSQIQAGKPIKLTTTSSSGTTYTATGAPTYTTLTQDAQFMFDVGGTACTAGAVTLNIDSLGAKRIYESDGATNPVAGDCAAHQILTLSYDSSGNFRIIGGGNNAAASGCSGCLAPFTRGSVDRIDEFIPNGGFGLFGELGWQGLAVGGGASSGGASFSKAYNGHPGVVTVFTNGSTSGDTTVMNLASQNTGALASLYLGSTAAMSPWQVEFTIITDDNSNSVASTALEMGFMDSNSYRTGNSIAIRYDTATNTCGSGSNSTTDWMLETFASGTSTCADTGVAVAAAQWYTFLIASNTLGTVIAEVSTNGGAFSSPVTISTNVPTAALYPTFLVQTHQTTDHRIGVDYWELLLTGLTR